MWICNWNDWTPFCCCSTQLMDAGTGNVTAEPWRVRPSGLQNSCKSIRRELKLLASLDHKQMFPSQPRILPQRRLEVWGRSLSRCLVTGHLSGAGKNHKVEVLNSVFFFFFCEYNFRWTVQSKMELHRAGSQQDLCQSPCRIITEKAAIELRGHQDGWRGHSPGKI